MSQCAVLLHYESMCRFAALRVDVPPKTVPGTVITCYKTVKRSRRKKTIR